MAQSSRRQIEEQDPEINWRKIAVIGVVTFIASLLIGRWFGSRLLESRAGLKAPSLVTAYPSVTQGEQPGSDAGAASPPRQNIASPPLIVPPPVVEPSAAIPAAPAESNAAPAAPDNEPTDAPSPAAAPSPHTQYKGVKAFKVQAGLFSSEDNAKDLVNHLREEGYTSDFELIERTDGNFYRVWVGPFDSHDEAESAAGELNGAGYQAFVLPAK